MKILFPAFILLVNAASANPIITPPAKEATLRKTWERCVISAGTNSATVSCAVGYTAKDFLEYPVYVSVPVFFPEGSVTDSIELKKRVKARLETGGKVLEPIYVSAGGYSGIQGVLLGECKFLVGRIPDKEFSIVVSYEQPVIEGSVYYMPLFEGGISPTIHDEFSVTFFPTGGGSLSLESKHRNKVTAYLTRVTVHPLHREIIKVATANREQAAPLNGP